jgi:hypothetical protein
MEAAAESSKDVASLNHRLNSNKGTKAAIQPGAVTALLRMDAMKHH